MLKIAAPAKINLGLEVGSLRPDGYHEVITLMLPLLLHDTIKIEKLDKPGIKVICDGVKERENLAYRAAEKILQLTDYTGGLRIDIEKRIPISGGLGGGSSDAAATLKGVSELLGYSYSKSDLMPLALELGSDVPFFIDAKPAFATGRGEILHPVDIDLPRFVVLVNPGIKISTSEAYARLTVMGSDAKPFTLQGILPHSYKNSPLNVSSLKGVINSFEEVTPHKDVQNIKRSLYNLGAEIALMSGSGPTVFGLFTDKNVAGHACASLSNNAKWHAVMTSIA